MSSVSDYLIHTTVRIESFFDKIRSKATGFFYLYDFGKVKVPVLVTNKHVIENPKEGRVKKGKIHFKLANSEGQWQIGRNFGFEINNFGEHWLLHPDEDVDLCIQPIHDFVMKISEQGEKVFLEIIQKNLIPTKLEEDEEFTAIEDIYMIGYPNGLLDEKNNLPIVRRGITATHPSIDYEGRSEFLIDAACFPGSSGSPVFLYNSGSFKDKKGNIRIGEDRLKFLGILYSGPQNTIINSHNEEINMPNNLGFVIKSKKLNDFIPLVKEKLRKEGFDI